MQVIRALYVQLCLCGQVFITLLGDEGVLPKKRLCHRQRVKQFTFVRGSKDIFYIRGPKLGVLSMITLEVCLS